jgi:hypothetical protein
MRLPSTETNAAMAGRIVGNAPRDGGKVAAA